MSTRLFTSSRQGPGSILPTDYAFFFFFFTCIDYSNAATVMCHVTVILCQVSCHCHMSCVMSLSYVIWRVSCHCHVTVMSLSCRCHVAVMSLSCHCHVTVMSLSCHWHVTVMSLLCHWHVTGMSLACHWHVSCHCRDKNIKTHIT